VALGRAKPLDFLIDILKAREADCLRQLFVPVRGAEDLPVQLSAARIDMVQSIFLLFAITVHPIAVQLLRIEFGEAQHDGTG